MLRSLCIVLAALSPHVAMAVEQTPLYGIQEGQCVKSPVAPDEVMGFLHQNHVRAALTESQDSIVITFPQADEDGVNQLDWYKSQGACQAALNNHG